MTRTPEQCRRQRDAELWIIAQHWIAQILSDTASHSTATSEGMAGLTDGEFRRVRSKLHHAANIALADVNRWADVVGRDRLAEILDEAVNTPDDRIAQQIARGARMPDEEES